MRTATDTLQFILLTSPEPQHIIYAVSADCSQYKLQGTHYYN